MLPPHPLMESCCFYFFNGHSLSPSPGRGFAVGRGSPGCTEGCSLSALALQCPLHVTPCQHPWMKRQQNHTDLAPLQPILSALWALAVSRAFAPGILQTSLPLPLLTWSSVTCLQRSAVTAALRESPSLPRQKEGCVPRAHMAQALPYQNPGCLVNLPIHATLFPLPVFPEPNTKADTEQAPTGEKCI